MTDAGKTFKDCVGLEARWAMQGRKRLTGPVSVMIDFWFARTNSDIDGPIKLVLDSCNGIVWDDDKQVVELSVGKHKALKKADVGVALTVSPVLVEAKERKAL
jgi:Holliday junction resolvase RusA-like endonuclease